MNRREKLILFFSIISLFWGMLNDLPTVHLIPDFFISKVEKFPEFMVDIYQIQATITTLSIALIALMSGISSQTVYGVSIAHYIMQMKPKVLKHKNIIIFLLSLILINYFFISFKFYNLVISIFIVTIVLIIFMSIEIFEVFKGREPLKKEIGNHIKGKYTEIKLLDTLFNDTLTAIDRDETLRFKENMDLLIIIFEKSIKNFTNDKALVAKWKNNLIEIFSKGLGKTRGKILKMSYEYFDQIYSILFKERDIAKEFSIWDGTSSEFLNGIRFFDIEELRDLSILNSIRWKVYKCQNFKNRNGEIYRNNHSITLIFHTIYLNILNNDNKISEFRKADIINQKKYYYDQITRDIYDEKDSENIPVIMNELKKYTKTLIDNQDKEVFKRTFIDKLERTFEYNLTDEMNAYYFSIIIYLYYLAYKKKLAEENLKIFSQNILKEYQQSISQYLLCTPLEDCTVDLIRQNLYGWKLMPEYDIKSMILDDIIDVFLIYYVIYTEKNIDSLRESIKVILGTNIFSLLNNVVGPQKVSIIESYKKFIKTIFNEDLAEGDIEDDLNRFVEILVDIYKSKKIEEAKLEALDKKEIVRYENLLNKKVVEKIIEPFKIFNLKDEENIERFSFHRSVFADAKILEKILDEVIERLYYEFTEHLLKFLIEKHQIYNKEVLFNDKNALIYLFDVIESYDINVNTLIGYKNKFHGYEKELEFKKLEDKSNKIKTHFLYNIVVAIDSNEILINLIQCEIEIKDINLEEKFKELEKDDKGRLLYNITNDIRIPFEREELQSLISDTQKEISLKIEYQYQVNEKISGSAITFRPKKYFETKKS